MIGQQMAWIKEKVIKYDNDRSKRILQLTEQEENLRQRQLIEQMNDSDRVRGANLRMRSGFMQMNSFTALINPPVRGRWGTIRPAPTSTSENSSNMTSVIEQEDVHQNSGYSASNNTTNNGF